MIEVRQASKRYGDAVVVDNVTLALPAGGVTALIGPNGAGKSTLLSMISRLLAPTAGQVLVDGLDVNACDRVVQKAVDDRAPQAPIREQTRLQV